MAERGAPEYVGPPPPATRVEELSGSFAIELAGVDLGDLGLGTFAPPVSRSGDDGPVAGSVADTRGAVVLDPRGGAGPPAAMLVLRAPAVVRLGRRGAGLGWRRLSGW